MSKTFLTKNDLPEGVRIAMCELLNKSLAAAIDLSLQSKLAHWNVKGPAFMQLHKLFDDVFAESTEWVDMLAERVVQMGAVAEAGLATIVERTCLPGYSTTISAGKDHVDAMSTALATFGKDMRAGIQKAAKAGDDDTADLYTEVSRGVDKMLWFVEAHLQNDR